jgi:hypothetical protein
MSTGGSLTHSGETGEAEGGGREGETSSWAVAMEAEVGFSVALELFGGETLLPPPPAFLDSGDVIDGETRSHSEMGRSDWGTTLGFQAMTGRLLVKQNLNL